MITQEGAIDSMLLLAAELRELPVNPIFVELVGSCAIQGQSPNDADFMVFAKEHPDRIAEHLLSTGWVEQEGKVDEYGQGEFRSFRLGDYNCLLVWDDKTYSGWLASVEICKYVGTTTRQQRVSIHQIIMDGQLAVNLASFDDDGMVSDSDAVE